MIIKKQAWNNYISVLRRLNQRAADEMIKYMTRLKTSGLPEAEQTRRIIDHAYGIATKYGEGATEAACEMYDAVAAASKAGVPPAAPAQTATYGEVARTVNGTRLFSMRDDAVAAAVSRLVKQAGVDTTVQNALRDGAEWAWIPSGDTCAFCLTLASQGWQPASRDQLRGNHAEHIHNNCDCTFAIRFADDTKYDGYDPDQYLDMYDHAPLDQWNTPDGKPPAWHQGSEKDNSKNRINAIRRELYRKHKAAINAQKQEAYAERKETTKDE